MIIKIKSSGFIALMPAVLIFSFILLSLVTSSESVVQYYETLNTKIASVQKWLYEKENEDRERFYSSSNL